MASEHKTVLDGLLLAATILFWNLALDWMDFRFPRLQRLLRPPALPLVRDGQLLRRHMRQELVTVDEPAAPAGDRSPLRCQAGVYGRRWAPQRHPRDPSAQHPPSHHFVM